MGRRRVSFKVAPGVRVSASSRGLRTSIGNSKGRMSFGSSGTYTSAKIGGVRVSQWNPSGSRSSSRGSSPRKAATTPSPQATDRLAEIEEIRAAENGLTTLHLADFPPASPTHVAAPPPTDVDALSRQRQAEALRNISWFKRKARKAARADADLVARAEAIRIDEENRKKHAHRVREAGARWARLRSHDPATVVAALNEAFADNASHTTCVDAGAEGAHKHATVIIVVESASMLPDRVPATTPAGRPTTKKRTKTDRNSLYVKALGSTALATVKEAFAVAPALTTVRVCMVRREQKAQTPEAQLTVIYTAEFGRTQTQSLDWTRIDPSEQLLSADGAVLKRKGATGEIVEIQITEPHAAELVAKFVAGPPARSVHP